MVLTPIKTKKIDVTLQKQPPNFITENFTLLSKCIHLFFLVGYKIIQPSTEMFSIRYIFRI